MIEFFFKKVSILSELFIFQSNLFHSIIVEGKTLFLKKSCFTFIAGISGIVAGIDILPVRRNNQIKVLQRL